MEEGQCDEGCQETRRALAHQDRGTLALQRSSTTDAKSTTPVGELLVASRYTKYPVDKYIEEYILSELRQ